MTDHEVGRLIVIDHKKKIKLNAIISVRNMKFEELSFAEAPKISGELPGLKSKKLLQLQREIEGSALSYPLGIPIVMEKGRGATVKDVDGNVFIDFFAGAGVIALGHCNPFVLEAVRNQQNKITHTLDFPTEIRLELIEKIRRIMPGDLKDNVRVQFGGPTGSDAVESAIKLAKYNQRSKTISPHINSGILNQVMIMVKMALKMTNMLNKKPV